MTSDPRDLLDQLRELQHRLVDESTTARQLRVILDAIPAHIFVTTTSGEILEVNESACGGLGYRREELIGLHPWDIDRDWPAERVKEAIPQLRARGHLHVRGTQVRKGGTDFPVEVSLSLIDIDGQPAVLGVTIDRSDQQEIDELRAAHAQAVVDLESLASASGLVHYTYDFDKRVGRFSGPVVELTGTEELATPGDILGRWRELVVPQDHERFAQVIKTILHPGGEEFYATDYRIQCGAGQLRHLEDRGRIIRAPDGTRVVGFLIDRTEQRELEHRLHQAERLEAVGRLAGGVCHDFNNLLTAIMGFTELSLAQLPPQHPAREHAKQALQAAQRARSVTAQLLAFSSQQRESHPQRVDLGNLASDLESLLAHLVGEQTRLEISCAQPAPSVLIDPSALHRVVLNLVMNAHDAMPAGGRIRLTVGHRVVEHAKPLGPTPLAPGAYATLTIEDEGSGIADDVLPHVFEPYFTTKPYGEGTGLGLASVYGILRQAEGAISIESEPGQGTRVVVYLPAAARGKSKRIVLVVDDDPLVRQLLVGYLVAEGYQALAAEDGQAALALASTVERLDLVISDVQMPGLRGPEVMSRLREEHPELPSLFISGYAPDDPALASAANFLRKPFLLEELSAKLRTLF